MKDSLNSQCLVWFHQSITRFIPQKEVALTLAALTFLGHFSARAQIQTAGTVFVNVDATTNSTGPLSDVTNSGSLGGYFELAGGTAAAIAPATNIGSTLGVNAMQLNGTNTYLRLVNGIGGGMIPPPAGLVGSNATCSIEVWAFNPSVAQDESMVAWGLRANGQNMAFEYGTGGLGADGTGTTLGGAQHFGSTLVDIPWDPLSGAPLNNHWHHLVYTYDGVNENLYADGALINSQPVAFNTVAAPGIVMGVQWTSASVISTSPAASTLSLARVRIHDGALTAAQVLNNYNFEKATFIPAAIAPQFLTASPVHRYSFNEPATNDASGMTFHDSIGTADGTVQGNEQTEVAQFSGRRLILPGGLQSSNSITSYGAPFAALPAGMVSSNSVNNGGTGELSIEVWYKMTSGLTWSSPRVFDIGSIGIGQNGGSVTGPGNYPIGATSLDFLRYAAQVFASTSQPGVNQRRLEWQNKDIGPSGSTTNSQDLAADVFTLGSYQTDRHLVVTWKELTGQIIAYENGVQVDSLVASNAMSALNDVNVWFGRSLNAGDTGMGGEFDEIRFYTNVLTAGQALGDFLAGPDTINTGAQAAVILAQPQSTTNYQGWPVSFYVTASGSPGVSYQWNRNGSPIAGATGNTYNVAAVALANNGDNYTCVVSNNTGTPNSVTSSPATLTVVPNLALPIQLLHETGEANPSLVIANSRDNYGGVLGSSFEVGSVAPLVTHLGYYDVYGDGLNQSHTVGIYTLDGKTTIASVVVPAGTDGYLQDGYRYVALNPPILLTPNTTYILVGYAVSGDGDFWPNNFLPTQWNAYFVGTNGTATRNSVYGGSAMPPGATSANGVNKSHATASMAILPIGTATAGIQPLTSTNFAGQTVTLSAAANGQAPLSLQWYKAPATLLAGQTNLNLTLSPVAAGDTGSYYVVVSNGFGSTPSANATLTVLADTPVTITQQPTNISVPDGYPVSFFVGASGTTPISYQWSSNSIVIPGATNATFSLAAVSILSNNNDLYSCVVSNFANGAPHTITSASAKLTVLANKAPVLQVLFETRDGNRNNFGGVVGNTFTVGATDALVTHLGFYCTNLSGLNNNHYVGIFSGDGSTLVASVMVPAGTGAFFTNGYAWVALDTPLILTNNTAYLLGAQVFDGDGDSWPDLFAATNWNSYFVGVTAGSSRVGRYGGTWPAAPTAAQTQANTTYGAPNLALIPINLPVIAIDGSTNVTQYVGFNATFSAYVDGQAPLTVQWYKSPATLLTGQTNASIILSNLTLGNSGSYYLVASNSAGTVQGSNVTLTVLPLSAPSITQQPQPQTVYIHQSATFTVTATGTPPLGYQWSLNGAPIAGATGSSLTLSGIGTANGGNYQAVVTNSIAPAATTGNALLTVLTPPANSYPAAVLNAGPLVYFRFSETDVSPGSNALNLGSLGMANTGTYEGGNSSAPGPQPPDFPNFESTNLAIAFDGVDSDVNIPSLNINTNSSPAVSMTLAAWIYKSSPQLGYAGIIFHRGPDGAAGFGVKPDPATGNTTDMLEYHWNNTYFSYNSGLDVPDSQWVLAALVVQPTQAILYLDSGAGLQSATNVATHAAQTFAGTTYVGFDSSDGTNAETRRFYGTIDEATIFGRALSADEIASLYQAAFPPPVMLQITTSGGSIVLSWPNGTLQQADQANGSYSDLTGATSPYAISPSGTQKFFRVKVQ